jgi:hypothetical protein
MGKLLKAMLSANLCLWIYFWLSFAYASQPYTLPPRGNLPVDPYIFWGHAIGITRSSLTHLFMKVVFTVEFPSFLAVRLPRNAFLPNVGGNAMLAGISVGGYELLAIMLLSFVQWYLVVWVVQKLWHRWSNHPTTTPGQVPSTTTTR